MKRIAIALTAALIASAAFAQQQPISQPCTYTTVQLPNGKYVTCTVCGSFTTCS